MVRARAIAVLAVALVLGPARGAAGEEPPDGRRTVPDAPILPALADSITKSVTKGVAALRGMQTADGSWGREPGPNKAGITALAVLAILKSGVIAVDPDVERGFAFLRTHRPQANTYDVAVTLMAIAAKYEGSSDPFATDSIRPDGRRVLPPMARGTVAKADREWLEEGVAFLERNQSKGWQPPPARRGSPPATPPENLAREDTKGAWGYGGPAARVPAGESVGIPAADLSNTQFALLGLLAGSRCGVHVAEEAWAAALDRLLQWQAEKGPEVLLDANEVRGAWRVEWQEKARARGFGYDGSSKPTGSMTAAGASGLLICQSALWGTPSLSTGTRARVRDAIRDSLAWLQLRTSIEAEPEGGRWGEMGDYYWLYGLERTGVLAHARRIGSHDWYSEGATLLLRKQAENGRWGDEICTSLALLFLRRASFRLTTSAITPRDPSPPSPSGK